MTDDPAEPVSVETNSVAEHVVTTQQRTAKNYFVFRRRFVYWVVGGFITTIILGAVAGFLTFGESQDALRSSQQSVENLTADLDKLREQLGQAQTQINLNRQEGEDREACRGTFGNNVSKATSQVLIELTQLLALLANDVPNDTTQAIAEIEAAGVALQGSQDARDVYESAGAPLPCPI